MDTLTQRLADARALVAHLDGEVAASTSCSELGHDWRSVGGKSCCCHSDAVCSIPVYECARCGGCDYGENPEAAAIKDACPDRFEDPDRHVLV